MKSALLVSSLLLLATPNMLLADEALPRLAVGDVIDGTAVILARPTNGTNALVVEVATDADFGDIVFSASASPANALVPLKFELSGLEIGRRYFMRATEGAKVHRTGSFTAGATSVGAPTTKRGTRFGVTGDWRGDVGIFNAIANADERSLDFFVKLGDTIYADVPSPAVPGGPAATLDEFRAKHVENYAPQYGIDPWGDLAASTATFSMIDDHEVTNDFDGGAFSIADGWYNQGSLYTNGLQAFVEHNAIRNLSWSASGDARTDGRPMLYRSWQSGADAAFFMVDARSFRDANLPPVVNPFDLGEVGAFLAASFDPTRTMLGLPQLQKLLTDLATAEAAGVTWKFLLTSMPFQNFGPLAGEDRWEGYAAERAFILQQAAALGVRNLVFVTADFHGTIVNDITAPNPVNPLQQLYTGSFEVITGSVAYSAPAGPTFAQLGLATGALTAKQYASYQSLPGVFQDQFIQGLLDQIVPSYGYSPMGIQDPSIDAEFSVGGPIAVHHYGWTEFEVETVSKDLVVTTYGVDWYSPEDVAADPAAIVARPITVRQKFTVRAVGVTACPADLNGDRTVDGSDLALIFAAWGPCGGGCDSDLDGDGMVSGEDLAILLGNWGGC